MVALVAHEATEQTVASVAERANALATELEAGPPRSRAATYRQRWAHFGRVVRGEDPDQPELVADGTPVPLFPLSPIGGREHPAGLGLAVRREGEVAVGLVSFDAAAEAAPGRAHGGLVAACVDEMFAAALMVSQTFAYTGGLTVRYRGPCSIGEPVELRAWVAGRDGRKLDLRCVGTSDGHEVIEASGVGVVMDVDALGW